MRRIKLGKLGIAAVLPLAAFAGVDEDLAQAAKSPYDIARFVNTHETFRLQSLWKTLHIPQDKIYMAPDCGRGECSTELVEEPSPRQVILIVRKNPKRGEVYLRFRGDDGTGAVHAWRFAGYFGAYVKDFDSHHRVFRFGKKPFWAIAIQGASGTGLSSEYEAWMDLTRSKFEPTFGFTTKGDLVPMFGTAGVTTRVVVTSLDSSPVERIHLAYNARFSYDAGGFQPLGQRSDKAVYVRTGDTFVLDASQSTITKAEIDTVYDYPDNPSTNEDYLHCLLPELRKVAQRAGLGKETLKHFLENCKDTPERRALQDLLAQR